MFDFLLVIAAVIFVFLIAIETEPETSDKHLDSNDLDMPSDNEKPDLSAEATLLQEDTVDDVCDTVVAENQNDVIGDNI